MLVIGAGVIGLTTALVLRRRGFDVTVIAERFAPMVTSVVAGALWEWPPAVCGHHRDQVSLARSKGWAETSYATFADLAGNPATGAFMRPANFYFSRSVAADRLQREKIAELRGKVRGFRQDPALIAEYGVGPASGVRDAYRHLAPMIDTDVYMSWLLGEARALGCRIVSGRLHGPLRDQEATLTGRFGVSTIVNCAGLGARELAEDEVARLRGALVRVRNDGRAMPPVDQAHCVSHDESGEGPGFIFILPRGDDTLVLGGLAESNEWGLDVGLDNHEPIRAMYRRCVEFLPILRDAEIDATEPVRVGLRPVLPRNVRLESEAGTRIVHNYGHGGSGVTFSWGCALAVAERVEGLVS